MACRFLATVIGKAFLFRAMLSAIARSVALSKRESAGAGKWHCSEFAKAHAAAPVASIAKKERLRALPLGCFCGGFRLRRECRVAFAVEEERHTPLPFLWAKPAPTGWPRFLSLIH